MAINKIVLPIINEAIIKAIPIGNINFFFILMKYTVKSAMLNQRIPNKINLICL